MLKWLSHPGTPGRPQIFQNIFIAILWPSEQLRKRGSWANTSSTLTNGRVNYGRFKWSAHAHGQCNVMDVSQDPGSVLYIWPPSLEPKHQTGAVQRRQQAELSLSLLVSLSSFFSSLYLVTLSSIRTGRARLILNNWNIQKERRSFLNTNLDSQSLVFPFSGWLRFHMY